MQINIHLTTEDIKESFVDYAKKKGFIPEREPHVTLNVDKGNARESESWSASICGLTQINERKN